MQLYRPVGLKELARIAVSRFRAYPERFSWQPVFYPVVTREYAEAIIRLWNSNEPEAGYCGFVTEFDIDDEFVARYPVQQLGGGPIYRELWVPSGELDEFNEHIQPPIRVVKSLYGPAFVGDIDPDSGLPVSVTLAARNSTS